MAQYHFWDSTADGTSGHFAINGVAQGTNQIINVSAAQLAQTTFQTGTTADDLGCRLRRRGLERVAGVPPDPAGQPCPGGGGGRPERGEECEPCGILAVPGERCRRRCDDPVSVLGFDRGWHQRAFRDQWGGAGHQPDINVERGAAGADHVPDRQHGATICGCGPSTARCGATGRNST